MLIRKVAPMAEPVRLSDENLAIDPSDVGQQPAADQVEVTSLQIQPDPDFGSDPYNCTGQHCIADVVKDS